MRINNAWTWRATWQSGPPHDRKPQLRTFSVGVHGYERAHEMAVEARRKGVEEDLLELGRRFWVLPPDSPLLQNLPDGIRRSQYDSGAQVWVAKAIYRGGQPQVFRFFPDTEYDNNPKKSLEAAKEFLAQEIERLAEVGQVVLDDDGNVDKGAHKRQPRPRTGASSSGIRRRKEAGKHGGYYWHWAVLWVENGRTKKKRFADNSYQDYQGKAASWWGFIEALAFRREREIEVYGDSSLPKSGPGVRALYDELMQEAEGEV